MKLIDKDALVAEIELELRSLINATGDYTEGRKMALVNIRGFINTLEVKEVDLEKENLTWEDMLIIHKCIKDAMNKYLYAFQTIEGQQKVYEDVLKRFKVQKGE